MLPSASEAVSRPSGSAYGALQTQVPSGLQSEYLLSASLNPSGEEQMVTVPLSSKPDGHTDVTAL